MIKVQEKKKFVQWYLNNFQMKKRESVWILNYLINHNELLENIHFVEDAKFAKRGILISSQCSKEVPFRFYKDHIVTTDAEKCFNHLRINRDEEYYIELFFKDRSSNSMYASVLEENPFVPDDYYIGPKEKQEAEDLLSHLLLEGRKNQLKKLIDEALDKRDEERFLALTEELFSLNS